jgi:hypothetical protein
MTQQQQKESEMCTCGHFGGNSPQGIQCHETMFQEGHGKCKVPNCSCVQFTWTTAKVDNKWKEDTIENMTSNSGEHAWYFAEQLDNLIDAIEEKYHVIPK